MILIFIQLVIFKVISKFLDINKIERMAAEVGASALTGGILGGAGALGAGIAGIGELSLGSIASTAAAGAIGSAVSGQAANMIPGEIGQGVAQVLGTVAGGAVGNRIYNRAKTRARGQQNRINEEQQALLQPNSDDTAVSTLSASRARRDTVTAAHRVGRGQRLGGNTPSLTPSQPTTAPTVELSPQPSNPRRLW